MRSPIFSNSAHIRQSRPDSGLGWQANVLKTFYDVPSSLGRGPPRTDRQFENNNFTEMCSGSEAGSSLRLIDFVYHPTLGLRAIKKKKGLLESGWGRAFSRTSSLGECVSEREGGRESMCVRECASGLGCRV